MFVVQEIRGKTKKFKTSKELLDRICCLLNVDNLYGLRADNEEGYMNSKTYFSKIFNDEIREIVYSDGEKGYDFRKCGWNFTREQMIVDYRKGVYVTCFIDRRRFVFYPKGGV